MRVYISGPLQGSDDLAEARRLYETIAAVLKDMGHDAYVPHLHTDPERASHVTSQDVFTTDVRHLLQADAIVAHVGQPSTGVGAELAIAAQHHKSIMGIRRASETASRFAEGLIIQAGGTVFNFDDDESLKQCLQDALGTGWPHHRGGPAQSSGNHPYKMPA